MKTFLALFLFFGFLALVSSELVPNFPGVQPIFFDGESAGEEIVSGENRDILVIDDYAFETSPPIIVIIDQALPISSETFDLDSSIIGGERDIRFVVEAGPSGLVFAAGASSNAFTVATPNGGSGVVFLQYDGIDQSSNLDTTAGLNGLDLTQGNAVGFRIDAITDISTEFRLSIYDSQGRSVSTQNQVNGGLAVQSYELDFSDFDGQIDFSSVNAIEFEIQAFDNVDFGLVNFVTYSNVVVIPPVSDCIQGSVAPCLTNYYRLEELSRVFPGEYITVQYSAVGEPAFPNSTANFYMIHSSFEDLQDQLRQNTNIVSTLGGLPGATQYDYICHDDCDIEVVWSALEESTYYLGVEGFGTGFVDYQICLSRSVVPVTPLVDNEPLVVIRDQRETTPPNDHVRHYSYFSIDVPTDSFSEGTYLVVNVSRVAPVGNYTLRLMHEGLPEAPVDTGVLGSVDYNSRGDRSDDSIYPFCVDRTFSNRGGDFFAHPIVQQDGMACECTTERVALSDGFQQTCQLTVDPCHFKYGTWYVSLELPERTDPTNPFDVSGRVAYTIEAEIVQRTVTTLPRAVKIPGEVYPEATRHYRINVPDRDVGAMDTHFIVSISNVHGGSIHTYVHQGEGNDRLAGGPEGCSTASAECQTCDACNAIVEKCHFASGAWYISVGVAYDSEEGEFITDRLPVGYTIEVDWVKESTPLPITSGVPVTGSVGSALYDFYVLDVPPTIDTVLYVELFVKANNTEVALAILHDALPGGDCYARPDFFCLTGDTRGIRSSYGPTSFIDNEPIQRESCNYMIQACELTAGPLYLSVYGHHTGYTPYGDSTFYHIPVEYTLYAEFDTPLSLTSGVSLSEVVYESHYQHYYLRVDHATIGSWLSVEVTNIQHGIPQSIEAYVNYNFLAGDCPCYENLYSCTQNATCSEDALFTPFAHADIESVDNCCTVLVHPSDFRNGIWYVAVRGVNEDQFQYTTPIGYTLTVTLHDAPIFNFLPLGEHYHGSVPRWNRTFEYSHFRLAANAIPSHDLVLKLTWVQNCDVAHRGQHDNTQESLSLYVNHESVAGKNPTGHLYSCTATDLDQSYCTIVIPSCEWLEGAYLLAVRGDYDSDFDARFTLHASVEDNRSVRLSDGVPFYDRVHEGVYKHFFIDTTAEEDQLLTIDVYTNTDQDPITVFINKDTRGGDAPCYESMYECHTRTCCSWQFKSCEMSPGRYYISVKGSPSHWYHVSTEFTVVASHQPVHMTLYDNFPVTGHLATPGQVAHYSYNVDQLVPGHTLEFTVDNVKHGSVEVYGQFESLAGRCPCYTWEKHCSATSDDKDWCSIRLAPCELEVGTYFFSVVANEQLSSDLPIYMTPIGFTVEASITIPSFGSIEADVGRQSEDTLSDRLAGGHYRHYPISWDDDDFDSGYHLIVEITNVRNGNLEVFYNPVVPGDQTCHAAQLCEEGITGGADCFWQLPYCLTRPLDDPTNHYISVYNQDTGNRIAADYDILIWKQPIPSVQSNPDFTLDDRSVVFGSEEFNVTHSSILEPNGWTQFIRLPNIELDLDEEGRGDMLELFFYRITNNINAPMSFNVYAHPNEPAGAHDCCTHDHASCQGAPCSHSADTTTEVNSREIISHTCDLPNGIGNTNPAIPYFGEQCVVRIYPCEFNKYCDNEEPTDWFLSLVPIAPTDLFSDGPGLSYSFQWRVRNIRTQDSENREAGTVDLSAYVDEDTYTPSFSVISQSSESEGWRSFFVAFTEPEARISIQSRFDEGNGVVYINPDSFASATPTCNEYECSNESSAIDCNSNGRFITSECCSNIPEQGYFITVRNTGDAGSVLRVSFRITKVIIPGTFQIPMHPSRSSPFSVISSVRYEGYDFYELTLDDDDLDRHTTWDISIFRVGSSPDPLTAYVRFGERAGNYGPATNQVAYGSDTDEGCFAWQYECHMETLADSCFFQIPACALVEGHWYISIHNPTADLIENTFAVRPRYELITFISDPPVHLTLNEAFIADNSNISIEPIVHYTLNYTAQEAGFDSREDVESYFTRALRFQLDLIVEGEIEMWVNYDAQAGPDVEGGCTGSIGHRICDSISGCYFDILPCNGDGEDSFKLKTGTYFIALRLSTPTPYRLSALNIAEEHTLLSVDRVEEGIIQRTNTENIYYTHTVTQSELDAEGDGQGNYRYVIDMKNPITDDDDMEDNQYFLISIDAPTGITAEQSAELHVWRDDCSRFDCALQGPSSSCTIDAETLGPCALKGGRYYMNVVNPSGIPFTLHGYLNETILIPILEKQEITEFLFPYEYQEYFYDAHDIDEGATLTVNICSVCGEVEAWILPDFPAGPTPNHTGESNSCSLDHCTTDGPVNDAFGDFDESNCCQLFLDTCSYDNGRYFVGIRGVSTLFPNEGNGILELPILYKIDFEQQNVNFTDISYGGCPLVLENGFDDNTKNVPQQFTFDVESVNVGSSLRVALQIPHEFATLDMNATVSVHFNHSHGYSSYCEDEVSTNLYCWTTSYCEFLIPYCQLAQQDASRLYILADAPKGSVISVDRWDPIVPVVSENVKYHSSISLSTPPTHPYQSSEQVYRFSLHPEDNRFYARVHVDHVAGGMLSMIVNSGPSPYGIDAACTEPLFLDTSSCVGISGSCFVEIKWRDVQVPSDSFLSNPSTFWLTVQATQQDCTYTPINYSFVIESNFMITYFPVGHTVCEEVHEGDYNFHLISDPVARPQDSYLRFTIQDLQDDENVALAIRNGRVASVEEETIVIESSHFQDGVLVYNHYCSQEELYFSVYGMDGGMDGEAIQYRVSVERESARIKELFDDSVYYHDDDDNDACGGDLDFYIFPLTIRDASPDGSFFRVAVDSETYTEVTVTRGSLGGPLCYNAAGGNNEPEETGTTTINLYDFCDYSDDAYYVSVYAEGPYYIYTDIRDDPKALTLGEVFRDELEPGMYQMYTLEICDDWFEADDRLVIEITDVEHGDVYGWINVDSNPGSFQVVNHGVPASGTCSMDSAHADFGASASGYDFLLIDSCELIAGTYHILIRAAPHENSPERNCQHVEYRLFPYLVDYQIDPEVILPNSVLYDSVDAYTINRIQEDSVPFMNYYSFTPLQDAEGYMEQISHAVIRLANVEGGLLRLRVMCGHLAVAEFGYVDGEIYGLTSTGLVNEEWHMQSGRNPFTYQRILDPRSSAYQPECDGCTDFCCEMSFDENEDYEHDSACAIWIPSCYLVWADLYIAVEPVLQFSEDHSITYDLSVSQTVDFIRLESNTARTGTFEDDNWDFDFFYSVTDESESMRWRVVVTGGEGVLVTVRNHRCPLQASWSKDIWCDAKYFDRPWMCDIEIPTLAAHPGGANAFFISVYGKNATYSIASFVGRENCHKFVGSGRSDSLDFCAGLVPYATWRWDSYERLDDEAECLFDALYDRFKVQPCFTGVTAECNSTMAAFACYESFHACDEFGFAVPTCRQACESVERECFNSFADVALGSYECSSIHYGDGYSHTCTMPDGLLDAAKTLAIQEENSNLLNFVSSPTALSDSNSDSDSDLF